MSAMARDRSGVAIPNRALRRGAVDALRRLIRFPRMAAAFFLLCAWVAGFAQPPAANQNLMEIESLIQQGRWREARTAAQREIEQHPSSVEAYNLLGISESGQEDFQNA